MTESASWKELFEQISWVHFCTFPDLFVFHNSHLSQRIQCWPLMRKLYLNPAKLCINNKTENTSKDAPDQSQNWAKCKTLQSAKLCKMQNAILGKTTERKMSAQPEFCRKAGGWKPLPNGLWGFFSEYKPLLLASKALNFHHLATRWHNLD